jgi:hypothetical protein
MANYDSPQLKNPVRAGISGNLNVTPIAEIVAPAGDIAIGSVLRFHKLPPYCRLIGCIIIPDTATASLTGKVGHAAVDGDATAGDDDSLIVAATSFATAARVRENSLIFAELTKESYIQMVTAGAAIVADTKVRAVTLYEYLGAP